ncbi:hypothetical protein SAMN04488601_10493 [Paenibacillus sp. 453mf]|nr:hypothetical protein SAMN04488601_10493 [Paenibacillus sp. 453mf]
MTRIKVPTEVLLSVSDQFDHASNQVKGNKKVGI